MDFLAALTPIFTFCLTFSRPPFWFWCCIELTFQWDLPCVSLRREGGMLKSWVRKWTSYMRKVNRIRKFRSRIVFIYPYWRICRSCCWRLELLVFFNWTVSIQKYMNNKYEKIFAWLVQDAPWRTSETRILGCAAPCLASFIVMYSSWCGVCMVTIFKLWNSSRRTCDMLELYSK